MIKKHFPHRYGNKLDEKKLTSSSGILSTYASGSIFAAYGYMSPYDVKMVASAIPEISCELNLKWVFVGKGK